MTVFHHGKILDRRTTISPSDQRGLGLIEHFLSEKRREPTFPRFLILPNPDNSKADRIISFWGPEERHKDVYVGPQIKELKEYGFIWIDSPVDNPGRQLSSKER